MKLAVRAIQSSEVDALLHFYSQTYGHDSYQSSRRYFDWLYMQNPAARGIDDCIVALDQGSIVGCVHRMRLPCESDAGRTTLASLQNHVVSERLRSGAGIMLLQRAVRGESITFSPGVSGRLREAYRRLGYDEVPSYWLMRILNPVTAVVQGGMRRVTRDRWPSPQLSLTEGSLQRLGSASVTATLAPSAGQLTRLADEMTAQARRHTGAYVPWTAELLRWRYFSPTGPRHLLFEKASVGAWAVLSYGVKSRLNVARMLEHDAKGDTTFVNAVMRDAARIGAAISLAYTTRPSVRDDLSRSGFRLRREPPSSFSKGVEHLAISGAATDVGFEAVLTGSSR